LAGFDIAITPARARPGVEQNGDDRQIDPRTRSFGRVGVRRNKSSAVDSAGREMPPPAMMWDTKIRITTSRHIGDTADDLVEVDRNEPKIPALATLNCL